MATSTSAIAPASHASALRALVGRNAAMRPPKNGIPIVAKRSVVIGISTRETLIFRHDVSDTLRRSRNDKNVDLECAQDLFGYAAQKNLGDTRTAVRPDNKKIGIHFRSYSGYRLEGVVFFDAERPCRVA